MLMTRSGSRFLSFALASLIGCFLPAAAKAGPNAGGTLLLHVAEELQYTSGQASYCRDFNLASCDQADTRIDGLDVHIVYAVAAFPLEASPRLSAVSFGLQYDAGIKIVAWSNCADFEVCQFGWPRSGFGTALSFNEPQAEHLRPVYWFAMYSETGEPGTMRVVPHPGQGAAFADDSLPVSIDPVETLGTLGFGASGSSPCGELPLDAGACCVPGRGCIVAQQTSCEAWGGWFQGVEVACSNVDCEHLAGACCLPDGSCEFLSSADCDARLAAIWVGANTTCSPATCAPYQVVASCCFVDGSCRMLSPPDCRLEGGRFQGEVYCDPNPCPPPPPVAACCLRDGSCLLLTRDQCDGRVGDWIGDAGSCDPTPCPEPKARGACCVPLGSCYFVTSVECANIHPWVEGVYLGDDVSCDPSPCPLPEGTGACCARDGSCMILPYTLCDCCGRAYLGDGSTCDPDPCAAVMSFPCCLEDGCRLLAPEHCEALGGELKPEETACNPSPCPVGAGDATPGACCMESGACSLELEHECVAGGGTFLGQGSTCEAAGCARQTPVLHTTWGRIKARHR